jgi:hypothetical protein
LGRPEQAAVEKVIDLLRCMGEDVMVAVAKMRPQGSQDALIDEINSIGRP